MHDNSTDNFAIYNLGGKLSLEYVYLWSIKLRRKWSLLLYWVVFTFTHFLDTKAYQQSILRFSDKWCCEIQWDRIPPDSRKSPRTGTCACLPFCSRAEVLQDDRSRRYLQNTTKSPCRKIGGFWQMKHKRENCKLKTRINYYYYYYYY